MLVTSKNSTIKSGCFYQMDQMTNTNSFPEFRINASQSHVAVLQIYISEKIMFEGQSSIGSRTEDALVNGRV